MLARSVQKLTVSSPAFGASLIARNGSVGLLALLIKIFKTIKSVASAPAAVNILRRFAPGLSEISGKKLTPNIGDEEKKSLYWVSSRKKILISKKVICNENDN